MRAIQNDGWAISPNGQYVAIPARNGVYIQDVQAGSVPKLIRTGFMVQGVGWYPDSSKLLVDGPGQPLGGRGPVSTANSLFEITLKGRKLGRWQIKPYPAYDFNAEFIHISAGGEVYAEARTLFDPLAGGKPTMPTGYYLIRLRKRPSYKLITRSSSNSMFEFGVNAQAGRLFVIGGQNEICSVSIASDGRHCIRFPGSPELVTVEDVQVALPPS